MHEPNHFLSCWIALKKGRPVEPQHQLDETNQLPLRDLPATTFDRSASFTIQKV
jgi:hypothetical protein